jgi:signal transduction histidine kinase/CheY-like chemotaxis protein
MSGSPKNASEVVSSGIQRLIEGLSEAVACVAPDGVILHSNNAFVTLCGNPALTLPGNQIADAMQMLPFAALQKYLIEAFQGEEKASSHPFGAPSKDHTLHARYIPHRTQTGAVEFVFLHLNLQSPRKGPAEPSSFTQDFPHLSETQFVEESRPIGLGFWSLNVSTKKLSLSDRMHEDWSIDADSYVETMHEAIARIYEPDQAHVFKAFDATVQQGAPYWVEYRMLLQDGRFMWIESRAEIICDADGKVIRLTGTVHDITSRKRVESIIRESEKWFRILTDFLPQMIWTAKPDGRPDYYNQKWLDYVELDAKSALQQSGEPFIHEDDLPLIRNTWSACVRTGQSLDMEVRLLRASDQTYRWHLTRAVALRDESGRIVRWLGTSTDTEDQKQLMVKLRLATLEAEKAASIKSSFLANMSHEIRTPLAAIIGFTNLLSDTNRAESERSKYLQIINRNSKSLSVLINDILDISKFESGHFLIEEIDFRIDLLIEEILSIFSEVALSKQLTIRLNIEPSTHLHLKSDPSRLRQILVNVIGNSIKFTSSGDITISVTTMRSESDHWRLLIEVSDSGIGLTDEQAAILFEPFSQADQSTTRKYGGSGLGLTLSRRLARALGGDVSLKSYAIGRGCKFLIEILAGQGNSEYSKGLSYLDEEPFRMEALPYSSKQLRILLVEDAAENRFLVTEILGQKGYQIDTANDGSEGISMASANSYDLILMDMQMPVTDGFEATRFLRAQGFKKPIIALTALAMEDDRLRILACGCNEHLTKPLNFALLIDTIQRLTTDL